MRNFQKHQNDAKSETEGFALLLSLAVIGTTVISSLALAGVTVGCTYGYLSIATNIEMPASHWSGMFLDRLIPISVVTLLAIGGTAVYRSLQWAEQGGCGVAKSLGGSRVSKLTDDFDHRKLINVVEELAIASSSRVPNVYVLEDEQGINAFAAGVDPKHAVIGVTQGAVKRLKRHQLQGVIAHEFSHIQHGDMRLNSRLMGVLAGIQAITFAANFLIRMALTPSRVGVLSNSKHPLGSVLALVFGCALWPIGQIGSLFALMLSMAINRQREFLADASAVQYTRDPHGLREALQILLEDEVGSRLVGPASLLASHMCFASVESTWQRFFQTHPSLEERIQRLGGEPMSKKDASAERQISPTMVVDMECEVVKS